MGTAAYRYSSTPRSGRRSPSSPHRATGSSRPGQRQPRQIRRFGALPRKREPPFFNLPLSKLLKQWPACEYKFRGTGPDGQVLVERETTLKALPVVTLDVMMPPSATRLRVPPGFHRPNTEYSWEIL